MVRYYCTIHQPLEGTIPEHYYHSKILFERRYVPEIDRMVWGWIEFREELTPQEIADYGLIRQPREVEP